MATYTVVGNVVQGLPQTGTNVRTSNPLNEILVTNTQVGGTYYYKGAVIDQALISPTQGVIDSMVSRGILV
jgi:hypothetical protein